MSQLGNPGAQLASPMSVIFLQHTSSRTGWSDKNKSLWCGWAVLGTTQRFWFAGDTGYCGTFKEIGQQYGPFDLCAIPIASYTPRWMLKPMHVNPADAVQIHQVSAALNVSSA